MPPLTASVPRALALAAAVCAAAAAPAGAQITLAGGDANRLTLSGYLRSLTGLHDRGYDLPGTERSTGFHGEVVRVKWRLETGSVVLDAHQRLQARVASGEAAGGPGGPIAGFGVSAVPARSLDLSTDLVSGSGLRVWHDIDRLSLGVRTPAVDLTLGRQPITWGVSSIFPVADLWTAFSPFELDTEEKPGIDAVRALFYPAPGVEMDAVVADRGTLEDLSAGLRATWGLEDADLWAGAGKLWRQVIAMGGVTMLFRETRVRAEAVLPWSLDDAGPDRPRATVGIDWIRTPLSLTGEYHYNGIGATTAAGYLDRLRDPRVARGETYFLGRHYLGAAAAWTPGEAGALRLALSALANLGDPSVAVTPVLDYDLGTATSVSVGALLSAGDAPVLAPAPELRSEFGAYGDLVFTRVSIYF